VYRLHRGFSRLRRLNVARWTKKARNAIRPRSSDAPSATAAHEAQRPYLGPHTGARSSPPGWDDAAGQTVEPRRACGARTKSSVVWRYSLGNRPRPERRRTVSPRDGPGSLTSVPLTDQLVHRVRLSRRGSPGMTDANSILDRPDRCEASGALVRGDASEISASRARVAHRRATASAVVLGVSARPLASSCAPMTCCGATHAGDDGHTHVGGRPRSSVHARPLCQPQGKVGTVGFRRVGHPGRTRTYS
jgi:hypothetical protein